MNREEFISRLMVELGNETNNRTKATRIYEFWVAPLEKKVQELEPKEFAILDNKNRLQFGYDSKEDVEHCLARCRDKDNAEQGREIVAIIRYPQPRKEGVHRVKTLSGNWTEAKYIPTPCSGKPHWLLWGVDAVFYDFDFSEIGERIEI